MSIKDEIVLFLEDNDYITKSTVMEAIKECDDGSEEAWRIMDQLIEKLELENEE